MKFTILSLIISVMTLTEAHATRVSRHYGLSFSYLGVWINYAEDSPSTFEYWPEMGKHPEWNVQYLLNGPDFRVRVQSNPKDPVIKYMFYKITSEVDIFDFGIIISPNDKRNAVIQYCQNAPAVGCTLAGKSFDITDIFFKGFSYEYAPSKPAPYHPPPETDPAVVERAEAIKDSVYKLIKRQK